MDAEQTTAILAGAIGVFGSLAGVALSTWLGGRAERVRQREQDARRWLVDRRTAYATLLGMAESMLRDIDGIAVFLSYDGTKSVSDEDESLLADGLADFFVRWEDELQPALGEVQLLADTRVADLADRVSGALMELTGEIETRGSFVNFYPSWFRAKDLIVVLRNAMRTELGLAPNEEMPYPRLGDWPWLPDRPSEEEYIRRQAQIPGRHPLTEAELARLETSQPPSGGNPRGGPQETTERNGRERAP